jgi:type 1 glutamine amidotransferase
MRFALMLLLLVLSKTVCAAEETTAQERSPRIRVLLLSGQNNHDWQQTTPALQKLFSETGRFEVDVTQRPAQLTAEMLEPYDVILSNWNRFDRRGGLSADWPKSTQEAYVNFVRSGKGHVVVHAGSSSFPDWVEYQKLSLATWQMGKTGHGPIHDFNVRLEAVDHPITRGLSNFKTRDELWHRAAVQQNATVLASAFSEPDKSGSGQNEPVALIHQYGQGRAFTLLLGHDVEGIGNPGFAKLLTRGTQWAATGQCDSVSREGPTSEDRDHSPQTLTWDQSDSAISLLANKKVIWKFHHGADISKPFFHPIALPSGPILTTNQPEDHPWHHGLWFCWKYINGINYWEEDRKTGQSAGKTIWDDLKITKRPDHSAIIEMDIRYQPTLESEAALTERRTINISPPGKDGSYTVDWSMQFTAPSQQTRLDRTPIPGEPDGKGWGGYAGLSARLTSDFSETTIVTAEGPVDLETGKYRGKSRGLDFSGRVAGQEAGLAIIDHPGNLNAPSPWYVIDSKVMKYFSPAVICFKPHTLEPGQSMSLRYRVLVHPGRLDRDELVSVYDDFIKISPKK